MGLELQVELYEYCILTKYIDKARIIEYMYVMWNLGPLGTNNTPSLHPHGSVHATLSEPPEDAI